MTESIFDISILNLVIAYIFIIILLIIVKKEHIGHEKQILIASLRMTIQLVLVGYLLTYVFENPNPFITAIILLIMETFAIFNIFSRVDKILNKKLKIVIGISMFSGTLISILFFLFIVIRINPWYMPQYFIPISGMLIGNSMTGISLGAQGLITGISDNKELIENSLMLGATPTKATKDIQNRSFYNAVLPTINSMIGMGIVFLPGMMTGQILAGAAPLTAIKYQIAIMMGILGSVTLTVYLMVKWGMNSFFNERAQLIIEE